MIPRIEYGLPPLSEERKRHLEQVRGLKPYSQYAIPKWADPDTIEYKIFTGVMAGASALGMIICNRNRGPKLMFSCCLVLLPLTVVLGRKYKGERVRAFDFFERHFEQHLEWFPVTRKAFNRAMEVKNKQIQDLENELAEKQAKLKQKMAMTAHAKI